MTFNKPGGYRPRGSGRGNEHHPLYMTWLGMKQRCSNRNNVGYRYYGGRGISVCNRWVDDFWNFVEDMGPKPTAKHSIDRINNDVGYEPDNCRWATRKEQYRNSRKRNLGGENAGTAQLKEIDVVYMICCRGRGMTAARVARNMKLKYDSVRDVFKGRRWGCVTGLKYEKKQTARKKYSKHGGR